MTIRNLFNSDTLGVPPVPRVLPMVSLLDSAGAPFNETALPASSAWRQSEIIGVELCRRATIRLSYDASASTTTGYPLIMVLCCGEKIDPATGVAPLVGDDVWHSPMITDGSITATATTGTLPTGADWSNGPLYGYQIFRPLVVQPPAAVANSNKIRAKFTIDVTDEYYMYIIAQEKGDATNRGTLTLWVNGS